MEQIIEPIINRHASWIVVNPVQGCPNACQYCFMEEYNATRIKPKELVSPDEVLDMLMTYEYYLEDIPVCLFSTTDIFSCTNNIEYLAKLLQCFKDARILNPIILITKCYIPTTIIDQIADIISCGQKIIVYLSYSGLSSEIERGINHQKLRENFCNLYDAHIPIVHYFRPILPQNSSEAKIDEILSFVSQYCDVSVVTGLKCVDKCMDNYAFWPEVQQKADAGEYECIWPLGSRDRLIESAKKYNHYLYETNSCALAHILCEHDKYGFFEGRSCLNFNVCGEEQKQRCQNHYYEMKMSYGLNKQIIIDHLKSHGYDISEDDIAQDNSDVYIDGCIDTQQISDLSYRIGKRIFASGIAEHGYWHISLNQKGGVEI